MRERRDAAQARILVALDGSRLAESVLPLAQAVATSLGARLTLLHVLEQGPPSTVHGERHIADRVESDRYLEQIAGQLRSSRLPVDMHTHANPERNVPGSIATHAAELGADLIVLCAHGAGGIREWLVGRIPQQVAALAGRPVLIVPAPAREFTAFHHILIPVDQVGDAQASLSLVRRLAAGRHAGLTIVTVVPTPNTLPGEAGAAAVFLPNTAASLLNIAEDEARAQLAELAVRLTGEGFAVETEVRRGDPARELLQVIGDRQPDLVVLATHARAGLDGLLAGSVGPRVVNAARCPVLLVPI